MYEELVQGLRDLADYIEENEDALPIGEYCDVNLYEYVYDEYDDNGDVIEGSALTKMKSLAKVLKPCEKDMYGDTFALVKRFGKRVSVEFSTSRKNVCKRKVVGTEVVPARVIEEHTREIVEWECDEPLLKS